MFLAAGSDATEQDGRLIILRHTQGYILHAKDTYRACSLGGILEEFRWFGGICEMKTLFRMKKEADQAGFKDTRTGP